MDVPVTAVDDFESCFFSQQVDYVWLHTLATRKHPLFPRIYWLVAWLNFVEINLKRSAPRANPENTGDITAAEILGSVHAANVIHHAASLD